MTTTVTGLLCWRDFHPLEWQLASLHWSGRALQEGLAELEVSGLASIDLPPKNRSGSYHRNGGSGKGSRRCPGRSTELKRSSASYGRQRSSLVAATRLSMSVGSWGWASRPTFVGGRSMGV